MKPDSIKAYADESKTPSQRKLACREQLEQMDREKPGQDGVARGEQCPVATESLKCPALLV